MLATQEINNQVNGKQRFKTSYQCDLIVPTMYIYRQYMHKCIYTYKIFSYLNILSVLVK